MPDCHQKAPKEDPVTASGTRGPTAQERMHGDPATSMWLLRGDTRQAEHPGPHCQRRHRTTGTSPSSMAWQYLLLVLSGQGDDVIIFPILERCLNGFVTKDAITFLLALLNAPERSVLWAGRGMPAVFLKKTPISPPRGPFCGPLPGRQLGDVAVLTYGPHASEGSGFASSPSAGNPWQAPGSSSAYKISVVYGSPHATFLPLHPKNL